MKEVTAYIHTHWDREWYRTFEDFRLRLIEVFDKVLDALETGALPCFYFDGQTAALEDYLQLRGEKLEQIKKFIKQKRLFAGPFYCSSDSFLVPAALICRNIETGLEMSKKLGVSDFIAYIADSFGHSGELPVILKYYGIDKACLWRGLGDLNADLDWHGIKTVNLIQGYFQDFLHSNLSIEQKAENLKKYLDKISCRSGKYILLPIGGDHLAALENPAELTAGLNKIYTDYKISIGTPFDYFQKITSFEKIEGEFLDCSRTFLLKGVYSARPYIKRANARCCRKLARIAEPLNSIASVFYGALDMKAQIKYAYKELIKNHAHDSIYGCITDEAAEDVMQRFKSVNTIAESIIKRTIYDIEDDMGILTVINLSNYEYSGKVFFETEKEPPAYLNAVKISSRKGFTDRKLYNINDIPVTEDIKEINTYMTDVKSLKPFSLTKITPDKICSKCYLKTGKNFIENEYIKLEAEETGITLTDKKTGEIYKNCIELIDRADIGDSYNFGALKGDRPVYGSIKSVKLTEKNRIRAVISAVYEIKIPFSSSSEGRTEKWDNCRINFDFILYNQSRILEIKAEWENKCRNHLLQSGLKLKKKISETLSGDLFTGVKSSFEPDYNIYNYIPAAKGIELKTNTAPFQRYVNADNITLFADGINEYEASGSTLYLTLLRSTGIISNPENPARGTPAGPPLETPDMQCTGLNSAHYAIAFTNDEADMHKLAEEFFNLNACFFSNKEDKVFFTPEGRVQTVFSENGALYSCIYKSGGLKAASGELKACRMR